MTKLAVGARTADCLHLNSRKIARVVVRIDAAGPTSLEYCVSDRPSPRSDPQEQSIHPSRADVPVADRQTLGSKSTPLLCRLVARSSSERLPGLQSWAIVMKCATRGTRCQVCRFTSSVPDMASTPLPSAGWPRNEDRSLLARLRRHSGDGPPTCKLSVRTNNTQLLTELRLRRKKSIDVQYQMRRVRGDRIYSARTTRRHDGRIRHDTPVRGVQCRDSRLRCPCAPQRQKAQRRRRNNGCV